MTLLDDMAAARAAWTSPLLHQWYSPTDLAARHRSSMEGQADWVGDTDFGATFRDTIASVDGQGRYAIPDPLAWANRRLDVGDHWAVTGTRFRALDLDKPFVDIVATDLPPTPDALAAIADAALPAYEPFHPRALRVDAPDPDGLVAALRADERFADASIDQYVTAGLIATLRSRPRTPAYERVSPRRPDDAPALAARVGALYEVLRDDRPHLFEWATPAPPEDLAERHAEGLFFEVLVDGVPAGAVAARREDDHAMTGFQVTEIVLDGAHLGQRLAPAVLQRLLDELPANDDDALWGTIHPDNEPSRRNAASVGREVVGAYVWVVPQGLPGI